MACIIAILKYRGIRNAVPFFPVCVLLLSPSKILFEQRPKWLFIFFLIAEYKKQQWDLNISFGPFVANQWYSLLILLSHNTVEATGLTPTTKCWILISELPFRAAKTSRALGQLWIFTKLCAVLDSNRRRQHKRSWVFITTSRKFLEELK